MTQFDGFCQVESQRFSQHPATHIAAMTEEIIRKLTAELNKGITTEVQVVYLLAGIRKLLERDEVGAPYPALNFHCDWALHSKLDRAAAKGVLQEFDAAHPLLRNNIDLSDLPQPLQNKIERISKMDAFEEELSKFLEKYGLPPVTQHRSDGWPHFLHLYTQVIQDIPLIVKESSPDAAQNISKVTVQFEAAKEPQKFGDREELFYRVMWRIFDKNGDSGKIFIINSFRYTNRVFRNHRGGRGCLLSWSCYWPEQRG